MSSRNKARTIKFTSLRHVPKWYAQAMLPPAGNYDGVGVLVPTAQ